MQLHNHNHRRRSPSPPARRSLRPRRAATASSRPLVDDFFPFPSSPSSSPSRPRQRRPSPEPSSSDSGAGGAGASSASDRRRRKVKLVVKLSQLPPDQHHRRVPRPPPYSDDSDGEEVVREDGSGDENQFKPPKKRRIEPRGDRSRHPEVGGGRSDTASAPRTKRLPVPGALRTTPLPDRNALEMILDKLQKKDTYGVFAEPVDPEELPDYHDVIEHPMDFSTVRRKLARSIYRSFEQFEDDVFLICSNAMQYNAPDTIYFRQAHSIQELARKKFQELRDEGIPTENQIRSEQKFRPNSCNREPVKKPVLKYSNDDVGFLSRKEQVKRPNLKSLEDDTSFKCQVKKPISRTLQVESSIFHKERVKKPISRNSEEGLSSSFHKERAKKLVSRNSEVDLSSSVRKEQVRKVISRNSENDESFHKQPIKKPASQNSKDDLSSHKKHVRKPICESIEDPYFSSSKDPVEISVCTDREDAGGSTKRLAETATGKSREDLGHSRKNSSKKHICRNGQDDVGYSCNEKAVMEPMRANSQGTLGSDVSAATIASAGDVSNGLSTSQAHATEPVGCTVANVVMDKDISSPQDDMRSDKTDDIWAKPSYKSIVVDETRRKTYDTSEEQLPLESDLIFDVFSAEPKELINVGVQADHEYAYARSLARFAGSLGSQGWKIASERIRQALPVEVKYGRGWVAEYEPMLPSVLIVNDQSRNLKSSEGIVRRNASLPRDNERFRQTERNNPKDTSLSLLNRINTENNVVGVPGPLESPEFKPRIFGVTAESLTRSTNALSSHENHRVSGNVAKAKRRSNEQMRKCNSSSGAHSHEMQPQRDCSKGASTGVLDMHSLNKVTGQSRSCSQPPEAARTQQILKSNIPTVTAPQRPECAKGRASGVHGMPFSNGQPKTFFQSQEATTPQTKNEATWVYHGRSNDGKVRISKNSGPSTSVGFISNNQAVNDANFAMNVSGQKNFSEHAKSMGSTAVPGQTNIPKRIRCFPEHVLSISSSC